MAETNNSAEPLQPVKGRSLWADAWKRLLKNRMAVFGMVVVVFMSFTALFAGLIAPLPGTYQQLWIGAKPPGYTHPEVLNEMSFEVGKKPELPKRARKDGTLRFLVMPKKSEDFRLTLEATRIQSIVKQTGAEPVQRLEAKGALEVLAELLPGGNIGRELRDVTLEVGGELPERFTAPPASSQDRWVLSLARVVALKEHPTEILSEVKGGLVTTLTVDGKAETAVTISGREVSTFEIEGKPVVRTHWLGTDQVGRDVLSRVIFGGRISLLVGLVATVVSLIIGVVYGAISGYFGDAPIRLLDIIIVLALTVLAVAGFSLSGGSTAFWIILGALVAASATGGLLLSWKKRFPLHALKKRLAGGRLRFLLVPVMGTDNLMMRGVDILYGLPYMFLVILLLVNFGRDIVVLFIALGAVQWLTMARIVRGQVLSLREKEFIEAARMAGGGHAALLFRHLIPNTLGIVAVYTTLTIPAVILQESFLAFIGLAVQYQGENLASWGALVDEGRQALGHGGARWWMLIFPSVAMALTLFSLNFLGDGLRDALDPQQKGRT